VSLNFDDKKLNKITQWATLCHRNSETLIGEKKCPDTCLASVKMDTKNQGSVPNGLGTDQHLEKIKPKSVPNVLAHLTARKKSQVSQQNVCQVCLGYKIVK